MKKIILLAFCFLFVNSAFADRVAIIGGGAAGLVTAWLIENQHDVTLYEAQNRLGGNAQSVTINVKGKPVTVDAGAEFFNVEAYPYFLKLLHLLNIPINSFTSVVTFYKNDGSDIFIMPPYHDGKIEWKSLEPKNLDRTIQLGLLLHAFNPEKEAKDKTRSLKSFLDAMILSNSFKNDFFYPYVAALFGVTPSEIPSFSAYAAIKYLYDGSISKNYQWYEIDNGFSAYIAAVQQQLQHTTVKLSTPIQTITKNTWGTYTITTPDGTKTEFDQVVVATDAYTAGVLMSQLPDQTEAASALTKVKYFKTTIAIHGDDRFMPPNPSDWRLVNVRYDGTNSATTIYKSWKSETPIFKSWLNYDVKDKDGNSGMVPKNLYGTFYYQHPFVDANYYKAQALITELQGKDHLWYAGNWTNGNDSHESSIVSAINIAKAIAPTSSRLQQLLN